jgi:hypothetical protein
MASQKQIEANRRNARRSTGPTSGVGKAVARFNALKHGMTAGAVVLPYEDPHSYAELRESLIGHYNPVGAAEAMLVEVVVNSYWRLLRARRVEASALRLGIQALKQRNGGNPAPRSDDDDALAVFFTGRDENLRHMERYNTNIERSYYRAIETLRKVQNDRIREERRNAPAEKIGFVSRSKAAGSEALRPSPEPVEEIIPDVPFTDYPDTRVIHIIRPADRDESIPEARK